MEYCERGSLDKWIQDRHALEAQEVLKIGSDVLGALHYLRELRIIHRDVKPSNILLFPDRALLCDFGLATTLKKGKIGCMERLGTPHFVAPEMFLQESYTSKVDVWALGVSLLVALGTLEIQSSWDIAEIDMINQPTTNATDKWVRWQKQIMKTSSKAEVPAEIRSMLVSRPIDRPTAGQLWEELKEKLKRRSSKYLPEKEGWRPLAPSVHPPGLRLVEYPPLTYG